MTTCESCGADEFMPRRPRVRYVPDRGGYYCTGCVS